MCDYSPYECMVRYSNLGIYWYNRPETVKSHYVYSYSYQEEAISNHKSDVMFYQLSYQALGSKVVGICIYIYKCCWY